jgi:hypothetical protein
MLFAIVMGLPEANCGEVTSARHPSPVVLGRLAIPQLRTCRAAWR